MATSLTKKEELAVAEFKTKIGDILTKLDVFQQHPINLLRWIKARDFNLNNAEEMLRKSLRWRETQDIDNILKLDLPEEILDELPFQIVGHDKDGCVICAVPFGKWDLKKIMESGHQKEFFQIITRLLELGQAYMKKNSCEDLIFTQFVLICDFDGFTYNQIMSTQAISGLLELLKLFEANYPETLKAAYVVNAPKIFELFFLLIKPILTQRTLSKISIFGSNTAQWRTALLKNIEPRDLPANYGGTNCTHPFYHPSHKMDWFPRAKLMNDSEFKSKTIGAGEKFTRSFSLYAGDRISFNFKTDACDIGFQFLLNEMPLYPYARADAHQLVLDGYVECPIDGNYTLVFDNTYSKFTSKTVHYAILVENNGTISNHD